MKPTHRKATPFMRTIRLATILLLPVLIAIEALADETGLLGGLRRHTVLGSTIPENGDQNPYAVVVSPVTTGALQKDDVLIDNFNDRNNLQGLGSTIVRYRPSTKKMTLFASVPRNLPQCPGGVGMTAAMAVLTSGWVIVGSLPSKDGTTATKGKGCLIVFDANGQFTTVITSPHIDGPWGNMAVIDKGDAATLFISNVGRGIGAPGQDVVRQATVLRLTLSIKAGKAPAVVDETVIANGLAAQADKDVFIIGPTGVALGAKDTLYVSDAIENRIIAIDNATTRKTSAGTGREITKGDLLKRPLAMVMAPNGHLIVTNGLNGQGVEIDPATNKQIYAHWLDANKAQTPPGSGDLFGLAVTPAGNGLYYVEDEVNMLVLAQ